MLPLKTIVSQLWHASPRTMKMLSTLCLWIIYIIAILALFPSLGSEITTLVLLPVIVTAWLWGMWWGIIASIFGLSFNIIATLLSIPASSPTQALTVLFEPALPLALVLGGMVGQLKEMSQTLQQQHFKLTEHTEQLNYQAKHDPLTGLLNRSAFLDRLIVELNHAKREKHLMAIMFIDLDYFKQINDSFGHAAGDAVLREIAIRLKTTTREIDVVARLGGDEFAIAMSGIKEVQHVETVASKIMASFQPPVIYKGQAIDLFASIGISIYPDDGHEPAVLIERADHAMYQVKTNGKNDYTRYSGALN